jgi:hypothetical protein
MENGKPIVGAHDASSGELPPPLSAAAAARSAAAGQSIQGLLKLRRDRLTKLILLIPIIVGLFALDAAISFQFNTVIAAVGSDLAQTESSADQIARCAAALMMCMTLCAAIIIGWKAWEAERVGPTRRILALALAAALGVGSVLIASALTYPVFKSALDALMGTNGLPVGMGSAAAAIDSTPLWIRLLTATPFLAIGSLAGFFEIKALQIWRRLRQLAVDLAVNRNLVARAERALAAEKQYWAAAAENASASNAIAIRGFLMAHTVAALSTYVDVVSKATPAPTDVLKPAAARSANQAAMARHQAAVQSIDEFRPSEKIFALIDCVVACGTAVEADIVVSTPGVFKSAVNSHSQTNVERIQ